MHLLRDALPAAHGGALALRPLLVGVGNPTRGDDALGLEVAVRAARRFSHELRVLALEAVPPDLALRWAGAPKVLLVDAACSGLPPGTVHVFDALAAPLPAETLRLSTHGLGLGEAIELARALGELPPRLIVFAVEIAGCQPGAPLSPAAAAGVEEVLRRVERELG